MSPPPTPQPLLLLLPLLIATLLCQTVRPSVTTVDPTNATTHSSKQTHRVPWLHTAGKHQFVSTKNVANLSAAAASAGPQQQEKWERESRRRKPRVKDPAVEAEKQVIVMDFVRQHGKKIRESRRHADMFDGSGYLMDLNEELQNFEHKAKKERQSDRKARRKRRSVDGDDKPDDKPEDADEEEEDLEEMFDSLSDALAHLNGRHQADTVSLPGLNMVFNDAGAEKYDEEANVQEQNKEEAQGKRGRRSAKDGISEVEEDEHDDDHEEETARQLEAEQSLERLDANLREFAQLLDDDAELEKMKAAKSSRQEGDRIPFENYNRHLSEAYKGLLKLRKIAGDLVEKQKTAGREEQRAQPTRMPFEFLEKAASWQFDADTLREHVRELHKLHRKMDEL